MDTDSGVLTGRYTNMKKALSLLRWNQQIMMIPEHIKFNVKYKSEQLAQMQHNTYHDTL